jgi:hypothetical protein
MQTDVQWIYFHKHVGPFVSAAFGLQFYTACCGL